MLERRAVIIKVLINYPGDNSLIKGEENRGGVFNYYNILSMHFDQKVDFFTVGNRMPDETLAHRALRMVKDYRQYYRTLKLGSYDLIHLNPSFNKKAITRDALFLLIAKLMKRKVVVFMRGWDPSFEKVVSKYFQLPFRLVYFQADACIFLAEQFSRAFKSWGYAGPVYIETTVISNDFLINKSKQNHKSSANSTFNILFLSRLEEKKGIYRALDAYAMVKNKYPWINMTVAGNGPEYNNAVLYTESKGIDDVEFTGWVEGALKQNTFASADLYLFPSTHGEGMPNSVLEAMGTGLPVITRNVGGLSDFFEHGKMGFITDSVDPSVFAGFIEQLVNAPELCCKMGSYNHQYAGSRFSASLVAQRLSHIYGEILNA